MEYELLSPLVKITSFANLEIGGMFVSAKSFAELGKDADVYIKTGDARCLQFGTGNVSSPEVTWEVRRVEIANKIRFRVM